MGRPESPLDAGEGPLQRLALDLRKLRVKAGNPTYRQMAARTGAGASTLSQAAAGERLPTLATVLAYATACGGDRQEWEQRWHRTARELAEQPPADQDDVDPPYRGLARFEPGDRDLFFGRETLTEQLVAKVRDHRLVAVVGASGSGKSSLLRAGLIPALRAGQATGPGPAAIRIFTPGPHPDTTRSGLLAPAPTDGGGDLGGDTVVVIDQFEELFTLGADPAERGAFLERLAAACTPGNRLRAVIAVRADFFGRCADHPGLAQYLREATLLVGPMTPAELRQAVVKPATAAGLFVERELTAQILQDVADQPGGLPLMSHALLETWRRRRGRTLTPEMYRAAGGLHGAIAQTAETAYRRLSPAQAAVARGILLRLITPGEGTPDTRRPAERAELEATSPQAAHALEHLARARLITLDEDTADLAHEALITAWPRYRTWIEQDRERLRVHRRLTEAARTWHDLDHDPGTLYRGIRLAAAAETFRNDDARAALTPAERSFIDTSLAQHDRETRTAARTTWRLRALTVALSILLILATTAGLVAVRQSRTSDQARRKAVAAQQVALSRELAAESTSLLGSDTDKGMLLAVQAYRASPTTEATESLFQAAAVPLERQMNAHTGPVASLAFSWDGRTVAWGGNKGTVLQAGASIGQPRHIRTGNTAAVTSLAFSPDDRTLISSTDEARVQRTDLATGKSRNVAPGAAHPMGATLSADGRTAIVGTTRGPSGTLVSLDTTTGQSHTVLDSAENVLALSADRRTLATGRGDGSVTLWSTANGNALRTLQTGAAAPTWCAAFSPDGRTLATGNADGTVTVWDTATGHALRTFATTDDPGNHVSVLAFHQDGQTLAVGTWHGAVSLWDAPTSRSLATFGGYTSPVLALAFSPDGRTLASGSDEGTVRLWSTSSSISRLALPSANQPGAVAPIMAFTSGGRLLATTHNDGTVQLWDSRTGRLGATIRTHADLVSYLASSPGGHKLAIVGLPRAAWLWDTATRQVRAIGRGVSTAAISADGRTTATAVAEGTHTTIQLWDSGTGRIRSRLRMAGSTLPMIVALSPDGRMLATEDGQGNEQLVDAVTGHLVRTFGGGRVPAGQSAFSGSVAFSPDGHSLAIAGSDGTARIWDVVTGRLRTALTVNSDSLTSVAFSPEGRSLATSSYDGKAYIWDVATSHLRATLTTARPVILVVFSPDGHSLATSGSDGKARIWDVALPSPTEAITKICTAVNRNLSLQDLARGQSAQSPCPLPMG